MNSILLPKIHDVWSTNTSVIQALDSVQENVFQLTSQELYDLEHQNKGAFYLNKLYDFAERFITMDMHKLEVSLYASFSGKGPTHYNFVDERILIDVNQSPLAVPAILGHEFCHFLQYKRLPYGFMHSLDREKRYSKEAHADYFAGGYIKYLQSQGEISVQYYREIVDSVYSWGDRPGHEGIHGDANHRLYYFMEGYSNFDIEHFQDLGNFVRSENVEPPSVAGKIMSNVTDSY